MTLFRDQPRTRLQGKKAALSPPFASSELLFRKIGPALIVIMSLSFAGLPAAAQSAENTALSGSRSFSAENAAYLGDRSFSSENAGALGGRSFSSDKKLAFSSGVLTPEDSPTNFPASTAASRGASTEATPAEPSGATITFRKVFKTSYPEFVEIKLNESGAGTFDIRQLDEQANLQPFDLGRPIVQRVFELAGKLHDFEGVDLEVHHRLANLGQKTLRYENGAEAHEITFNYTLDPAATQLLNIFEGLTRQETDLSDLQRTMHYDRLGVNDVIVQIETDFNEKLLPEPDRLLPALDQVAADQKFIEIARQRARTLAARIRSNRES